MKLKQLIEYQTISIYTLQTRIVYQSADDVDNADGDNIFGDAGSEADPIVLIIYIDTQTKATHDVFDLLVKRIKELADKPDYKEGGFLNVEKKTHELG